ncbi:SDR family NAD(P)-dependent oxidoreductase [Streptomyces clavuligerus]|nr:SDR family NAD(P)-dependent oxidoreductase [Streptomyces clavuligerus]ANW17750.1 3-oxoacyl-ACP reductase [Streptomyces clavuligerus]AXU12300.1 SDR family oxidoreductase [Streptomyces clavuligerus]EDY51321.1 3-oxoacyl-ACP reductase [Streptomyces clavuligerus]MBY6302179.1 SDR family oxidoreductase [Streptomyces clavuligerus]QCS05081.1 SDR family NAD(P)-dependent oxidoreductase [Streptomyces clavuligerus]
MALTAYDLSGRTALVTGAASGIGRASAVLLAQAGADVHCADIDTEGLAGTLDLIAKAPGRGAAHTLDVTDRAAVAALVGSVAAGEGRLDIAAAIAGIVHTGPALETTDEDLERVLAVNLKGVLYLCQEAARAMIADGAPGSIITMSSGSVDVGYPGLLPYSVSKAAVVQLTRTFATELGPHRIRVNSVAPGWIRTPMMAPGPAPGHPETAARLATPEQIAERAPLGRVGEPEDVAHSVLFLASDASAYLTGQIIRPNGGLTMPW